MANEMTPVVWDDGTKKHRPLGTGEKMGGLDASSLLSSDSGNLLEAGSDGLAYLSGSGMVDPRADNLLEDSANGKLQVTVDRIAEWLDGHPQDAAALADAMNVVSTDAGNVIVQGTDKGAFLSKGAIAAAVTGMTDAQKAQLADAIAARIASDIADGKTIVASGGKLTADPTNATAAQKKAINQALADASSGLVVDNATGKLGVDFSQMPTDKFEALLAGLKMQVPLAANLTLHVDTQSAAAGDSIVDGRGTAAKPFKTIQACVSWAASYYSLGKYWIDVLVHPGYYNETVTLSSYNATTGGFTVVASDYNNPPVILRQGNGSYCIHVIGGSWNLRRLKFVNNPSKQDELTEHFYYCIGANGNSTKCSIEGCEFDISYYGAATTHINMYVVDATTGASVDFYPMDAYASKFVYNKGDSDHLIVLNASAESTIRFRGSNSSSAVFDFPCRGVASIFADANSGTMTQYDGTNTHLRFVVESGYTCSGQKYFVASGGSILAPQGGFPGGDEPAPFVESATYSWYKQIGS